MAFPIDPGRPPGIQPLEDLVPDQGNVDPRAMLPLAPAREHQHHDVRQHAGLGHVQHDEDMNLEDMLPLRQAFNLDQDDAMLEFLDDNNQLREHNYQRDTQHSGPQSELVSLTSLFVRQGKVGHIKRVDFRRHMGIA